MYPQTVEQVPLLRPKLEYDDTLGLLALGCLRGVGYRVLSKIHSARLPFGYLLATPDESSIREALKVAGLPKAQTLARTIVEDREAAVGFAKLILEELTNRRIEVIHDHDPRFPSGLKRIEDPPGWLFVEGNMRALSQTLVAIVGTRSPTRMGNFLTENVCRLLADTNIGTISGLASGIDERVHSLSLDLGLQTVAVLGTGILRDYPAQSIPLREAIVRRGGCIISEYMPTDEPAKEKFVWRNRLQAGLSQLVIPTEWQLRSGTAHTVNFALAQRKPLIGVTVSSQESETSAFLKQHGAPVFRLPHESQDLLDHVCRILA